jgi:hypothetical protein
MLADYFIDVANEAVPSPDDTWVARAYDNSRVVVNKASNYEARVLINYEKEYMVFVNVLRPSKFCFDMRDHSSIVGAFRSLWRGICPYS